jgi:hypothetical protein
MVDPHKITLDVRGKLYFDPEGPARGPGAYVYQRTRAGWGNIPEDKSGRLQLRRWVRPYDPHTPAQIAQRARMAAGVAAWHALSPEARAAWRAAGKQRGIPAYNAFLSAHMKTGI